MSITYLTSSFRFINSIAYWKSITIWNPIWAFGFTSAWWCTTLFRLLNWKKEKKKKEKLHLNFQSKAITLSHFLFSTCCCCFLFILKIHFYSLCMNYKLSNLHELCRCMCWHLNHFSFSCRKLRIHEFYTLVQGTFYVSVMVVHWLYLNTMYIK